MEKFLLAQSPRKFMIDNPLDVFPMKGLHPPVFTDKARIITAMDILPSKHQDLIERLKASPFYQICQNSFRKATGLPLVVINAQHPEFNPCHASPNQNLFCRLLNSSHGTCEDCIREQAHILNHSAEKSFTHDCFAGLKETSVPLRLGNSPIGYLKTGQVFTRKPTKIEARALRDVISRNGYSKKEQEHLLGLYNQTPVLEKEQYASMITLLDIISLQLTELLNRILLENKTDEPSSVIKAKKYIANHIEEKLSLSQIAQEVNVSSHYFCKLFKQSTGMTLTEYTCRYRTELAKAELKATDKPITEIAYEVGFQSLSQFNRSFCKVTGETPREYRVGVRSIPENVISEPRLG